MNRFLIFIFLLALPSLGTAASDAPLHCYFPQAEMICLAKVTSHKGNQVTFTVIEALRGKPSPTLILKADGMPSAFPTKSEWLLVSCATERNGSYNDTVGWQPEGGFSGWFPGSCFRYGKTLYVKDWMFSNEAIVLDIAPDGTQGLTLDHIKQLLKQPPQKP